MNYTLGFLEADRRGNPESKSVRTWQGACCTFNLNQVTGVTNTMLNLIDAVKMI